MIQAFLYDNANNILSSIDIPIENKLSYILCEQDSQCLIGYDNESSKFRVFLNYISSNVGELNLIKNIDNIGTLTDVLDYQIYKSTNGEKIFFLYAIKMEFLDKNKVVFFSLGINGKTNEIILNKVFDDDYYIESDDQIDIQFNFRELNNEVKINAVIVKNNNFYFYDLFEEVLLTSEINEEKPLEIYNVEIKLNEVDSKVYEKVITSNVNFIPFLFRYSDHLNLIILNSKGEIVGSYKIEKEIKNIKKVLLDVLNDGGTNISIYYLKDNESTYDLYKLSISFSTTDLVNEIHKLDTELKIDLGDNNGKIAIRNHNPMYRNPISEHKFLYKPINFDSKSIETNDGNVVIDTFDDNEINPDQYYENEAEIRNELYGLKRDQLKEIISNKFMTNLDALVSNNKVTKYDSTRFKENVMAQEFNRDKLGLVVTSTVDTENLKNRNTYSISDPNPSVRDNIAIEIDGINTNTSNEEMDFFISQIANINNLKLNEFNRIIFPFLQTSFSSFGSISIANTDLTFIYDDFKDYMTITKTDCNSKGFVNDTINSLIEYIQEKYKKVGVNIERNQIVKFISNYFESEDKGRNIISLKEKDSVYNKIARNEEILY